MVKKMDGNRAWVINNSKPLIEFDRICSGYQRWLQGCTYPIRQDLASCGCHREQQADGTWVHRTGPVTSKDPRPLRGIAIKGSEPVAPSTVPAVSRGFLFSLIKVICVST